MATVLVVDDEPTVVGVVQRLLEAKGHSVLTAFDGDQAMEAVRAGRPKVVLLDMIMPGKSGLAVLKEIKDYDPSVTVIMVTGSDDDATSRDALAMGAFDYIRKPFDMGTLDKVVTWALRLID